MKFVYFENDDIIIKKEDGLIGIKEKQSGVLKKFVNINTIIKVYVALNESNNDDREVLSSDEV